MGGNLCKPKGPDDVAGSLFKKKQKKPRSLVKFEQKRGLEVSETEISAFAKQGQQFLQKYSLGKRISSGAQGVTYLATEKRTGNVVVVKKPNDPTDLEDYNLLINKTHPNIVRVFEAFSNPLETYIVMECCSGGDLFGAMEKLGMPTQNWCAAVFQQVCKGANYIHVQFNEAHCDLKPENILLDKKPTSVRDVPRAMVGDFGCLAPINTIGAPSGGDPRYRAPEIWQGYTYSSCSDVWALGVTLYELVTGGLLPYVDKPNISGWANFSSAEGGQLWAVYSQCISSGRPPSFPLLAQFRRIYDLLTQLMQVNFQTRMTLPAALEHPWFQLANVGAPPEALDASVADRFARRARGQRLSMMLLDCVATKLQGESLAYYRDIWDQYDDDGDGIVDQTEFFDMMSDAGIRHGTSAQVLWQMGDRDQSGTISFQEFVALIFDADKLTEKDKMRYFKSVFQEISEGQDYITYQQMLSLFPGYPQNEVIALFQDVDTDRSGYIDVEEFEEYMKSI